MRLTDVVLRPFQAEAVEAWVRGYHGRPFTGTVALATGTGKTIVALACMAEASMREPQLRFAVVVPSVALAEQWIAVLPRFTDVAPEEIGLVGGGAGAPESYGNQRVLVAVLNTAAKSLPRIAEKTQPLMLVVDECHRAGAPQFSRVLSTPAIYRLGLSATPEREELDEDGEPLAYDEQAVGESLGGVVYAYTLRDALEGGWLPEYSIEHHGVSLLDGERMRYDTLSRRVDDAAQELRGLGGDVNRGRQLALRKDDLGRAASAYVALTAERKDLLFRAGERGRVVTQILRDAVAARGTDVRAILFHERVDEAEELLESLKAALPDVALALEHSALPRPQRRQALEDFASGRVQVLVSVKSLIEGIDVPEADIGVSVASTSSVRQRIQSLGRVLRKSDDPDKNSTMHIVYVADTVDEVIYGRADWSDLTGRDVNHYWTWPALEGGPRPADGPPRSPLPSEQTIFDNQGQFIPEVPGPWPGEVTGLEYSVSTNATVHNAFGRLIANPQGVERTIEAARGRAGGRFHVTPQHQFVLLWERTPDGPKAIVAGRLDEPFEVAPEVVGSPSASDADAESWNPGDVFLGPTDKGRGTYKLSQRQGGLIERAAPDRGREYAFLEGMGQPDLEGNAQRLLGAWNQLGRPASRCYVNEEWQAWYEEAGSRRFLALVPGGFLWPSDIESEGDT